MFLYKTFTQKRFSTIALHNYISLVQDSNAVSMTLMNSLETWSFEMMVLLSGLLPNPTLETSVLSIRLLDGQL